MIRPVMDYSSQVIALIFKDLLILNRAERAAATDPPNAERLEQWKCKRKRIRQELVQALSLFTSSSGKR